MRACSDAKELPSPLKRSMSVGRLSRRLLQRPPAGPSGARGSTAGAGANPSGGRKVKDSKRSVSRGDDKEFGESTDCGGVLQEHSGKEKGRAH